MATRHSWSKDSLGTPIFFGVVEVVAGATAVSEAAMVMEKKRNKYRVLDLHIKAIAKVSGQLLKIIYSKLGQGNNS
jgi:hypothetical protein